mgnify:CR=1 FL=1|tara:strand:+ start:743 stop:1816 length:1074 start_codon:yes stop_codon:yes gene_type:complete
MTISLIDLSKQYNDGTKAVNEINLQVEEGEFLTLLGPSGCGKSTTLRLIAGLEEASSGKIFINGKDVTHDEPGERNLAMVFQSYALYPHLTARRNITLGLTVNGMSQHDADKKANQVAKILNLEELMDRKPGALSGGERQRVALGRAMVREPACYLMDEPLSNLDLKLREHMRTELKLLHNKNKVTTIYVTHDQAEALILSDKIVVMDKGRIQQIGDPEDIYENPANAFVAQFIGSPSINLLTANSQRGILQVAGKEISGTYCSVKGEILLGIRPEDVIIKEESKGELKGFIEFTESHGGLIFAFISLDTKEKLIINRQFIAARIEKHQKFPNSKKIGISFREGRCKCFNKETGKVL